MNLRTDLALERHEISSDKENDGIFFGKYTERGVTVTEIRVLNESGVHALDKPIGTYLTFDVTPFSKGSELFLSEELYVLARHIRRLIPKSDKPVLVAGLGNMEITADALGPQTASLIFSTRHIGEEYAGHIGLGKIGCVAAVSPGVLGKTGIEAAEMLCGVVDKIKPCAVITVDALAARRLERIGNTVQMATSGIVPGAGVGNNRRRIDEEALGVPVLSIGVPTVVDGATFVSDILGDKCSGMTKEDMLHLSGEMTVTPKDIDLINQRASRLIAMSINIAFHEGISPEEIFSLVSQ